MLLRGSLALGSPSLSEMRANLYETYARELTVLADWCERRNLWGPGEIVDKWIPRRDPTKIYLYLLDQQNDPIDLPAEVSTDLSEWRHQFLLIRQVQADRLFALAIRAARESRPSMAWQLVTEAVRENRDHAAARKILGYEKVAEGWKTSSSKAKMDRGYVWHEEFGWLRKEYLESYLAGRRRYGSRWIDAEEDARYHPDLQRGWQAQTDHYVVTTNHSLESGVRLAGQLEQLYALWQQLFVGFYASDPEVHLLFWGEKTRRIPRRFHKVFCFRNRQEYNDTLERTQPNIDATLGIYFDTTRRAYFFSGRGQDPGTLFHEATHQLFQETCQVSRRVARSCNFWIIEGIAAYLESLTDHGDYWTVGGFDAGRMPVARHRLLRDGFYIPMGELTSLGKHDFQKHPELPKLYSQAAGLATFLMHFEGGRYRSQLMRYLLAVYTDQATRQTLAELLETNYEKLDRQYRDYLKDPL